MKVTSEHIQFVDYNFIHYIILPSKCMLTYTIILIVCKNISSFRVLSGQLIHLDTETWNIPGHNVDIWMFDGSL